MTQELMRRELDPRWVRRYVASDCLRLWFGKLPCQLTLEVSDTDQKEPVVTRCPPPPTTI